jgi:hypothetical protein
VEGRLEDGARDFGPTLVVLALEPLLRTFDDDLREIMIEPVPGSQLTKGPDDPQCLLLDRVDPGVDRSTIRASAIEWLVAIDHDVRDALEVAVECGDPEAMLGRRRSDPKVVR